MVVSAVAIAVMLPFALNRQPPPASAGDAAPAPASPTDDGAEPTAAESSAPPDDGARVLVIGDGYASGTAQGGVGPQGWPALLDERIEGAAVDVAAEVGAGYVATGVSGTTFGQLASADELAGADVVVVLGSRDDGPGVADQVSAAARDLYARITAEAELVVVGPVWPEAPAPAGATNNRDVLREQAETVGAAFVDPLEDGWFVDRPELLGQDGVYPTDEGHAYLAELIEPAVRDALDR